MDDTPNDDERDRTPTRAAGIATAGMSAAAGIGSAAAQEGGDGGDDGGIVEQDSGGKKGLTFQANFRPGAKIAIVSDVVDWWPEVDAVTDNIWSDYNTRIMRYLNTGEHVLLYVAEAAEISRYDEDLGFVVDPDDGEAARPQVYDLDRNYTLFGGSSGLVTVNFVPIREENEGDVLENEDWWRQDGG